MINVRFHIDQTHVRNFIIYFVHRFRTNRIAKIKHKVYFHIRKCTSIKAILDKYDVGALSVQVTFMVTLTRHNEIKAQEHFRVVNTTRKCGIAW